MTNQQTYSYPPTDPPSAGQPERVTSDPVPVPAPPDDPDDRADEDREPVDRVDADRADEELDLDGRRETAVDTTGEAIETRDDPAEDVTDRVPEETLDDEGTFEDPVLSDERTDPDDITAVTPQEADDEPAVDEPVTETELMPGDVPAEPVTGLWSEDNAQDLRDRWRDVQLRFIDDPAAAAAEARTLVDEAVTSLTESLTSQKNSLGEWDGDDTEHLRVVVRRYRDFLDRLLGL
jgi:hypothetical protein